MKDDLLHSSSSRPSFPELQKLVEDFHVSWEIGDVVTAQSHFHSMWERLAPWLYHSARNKGLNSEEAEDIVSETILDFYNILQEGEEIKSVRGLIKRILERRIVDFWRKRYGRSSEANDPDIDITPKEMRATDCESVDLDNHELEVVPMNESVDDLSFASTMNPILSGLEEDERLIMILRHVRRLAVEETARVTGLSIDQVKKKSVKAIKQARQIAVEQKHIEFEVIQ